MIYLEQIPTKFRYFKTKPKYHILYHLNKLSKNELNSISLYDYIIKLSNHTNFTRVNYYDLLPYHGNGILKTDLDYHDYFDQNKIFIRHYSQYLNHNDRYEKDTSFNIFISNDLDEDSKLIKKLSSQKFTLIYLLTISKITDFLLRQIKGMSHQEVAFLIFVDNKSNRTELYNLFSQIKSPEFFENLYLVDSPRFTVAWGQISIPFSQIVMICAIFKYFPNSMYISLHSETDYRIVPNDEIVKFLKLNYPMNYIAFTPKSKMRLKNVRLRRFSLFVNNSKFLENKLSKSFPNRIIPKFNWAFGSNWITTSVVDTKIIINTILSNFEMINHFEFCSVPDEVIFQTAATISKIKYVSNNLRYINWKKGGCHPKTLDENDFDDIVNNSCNFWARKFNIIKNQKLLDMIDDYVAKTEKENQQKSCTELKL